MDNLIIELLDSSDMEEIKDIENQDQDESTECNKDLVMKYEYCSPSYSSYNSHNSQSFTNESNESEDDNGGENFVPAWEIESNSSNSQSQSMLDDNIILCENSLLANSDDRQSTFNTNYEDDDDDDYEWQPRVKRRRYNSLEEKGTYEKNLFIKENLVNPKITHDARENDKHVINNKKKLKTKNSYVKRNTQLSDFIVEDDESEESEEIVNHSNVDLNIEIDCNIWTSNNWERDIAEIESIEKDSKHGLIVYITWQSGHRSVEPINILNKCAPQKIIQSSMNLDYPIIQKLQGQQFIAGMQKWTNDRADIQNQQTDSQDEIENDAPIIKNSRIAIKFGEIISKTPYYLVLPNDDEPKNESDIEKLSESDGYRVATSLGLILHGEDPREEFQFHVEVVKKFDFNHIIIIFVDCFGRSLV
ncbi:hypothetical protein Glove_299g30 [Diversispora epigaea]|uniref:Chromo shadow domain-containing protein n=1 Tax=Diversispora epigaea TaxID=1348612 RepID=A0A397I0N0_9GLOM|nr:hypothetical protein Glove_299g30 [Diversispora epigaea]